MIGYIIRRGKFCEFRRKISFVFLLGTQKNRLNETFILSIQTCKQLLSACLFLFIKSRLSVRLKLLWAMFALIFHACVGRTGSIEGLQVRDSQMSECCILEQETETGIKQKDKKSS